MRTLAVVGALVVGVVLVIAAFQRQLIYFPDRSDAGRAAAALAGGRDVVLRTSDDLELGAWWVPPTASDRDVAVLIAPGNGGNRAGRTPLARVLAERGFHVLLLDYRGYGGNPGSPSEAGVARDARTATTFLAEEGFAPDRTLYFGESLGTGVVAELAAAEPPAGVTLRSPFTSFADVAKVHYPFLPVDLVLVDRYPLVENLAGSDVPVLLLAGDADDIVPVGLSRAAASGVGNLYALEVLSGVGHNDAVWSSDWLGDQVVEFADAVVD